MSGANPQATLGQVGGGAEHAIVAQAKTATQACGQLVQMLKQHPGVDQAAVDQAGQQVGQVIMALLRVGKGQAG